ncbi:cellulose binding domain-containing protein [Herbidospora yilanensis]|uniref:cellulose binding domain-containing protein n=1 Tax=Herbidospora yilanensis TaxID=354426 RepID=UPI000782E795|nr:cellulose binding domain-containing protein [Herbidospora yilanensis]
MRILTALAVAAALVLGISAPARAMTYSCDVTYDTSVWTGGFVASITVENTGTSTFSPWLLQIVFAGDETMSSGWSATWTQTPPSLQAVNPVWAPSIAPGTTSAPIGFVATYTGTYVNPTGITLNGVPCTVTYI